ncbi:hypothetical protein AVEN_215020-1 [Araneus ventricosus]|uniref:Endonuclease/exonuclease/phosphatase domain-containing protein n=1 Tax=Araneus ventricosus TaxID=182803 RepID=A0A4Y2VAX4_ARAVE|nr:hypothetical protein AVEN_215020-1 [Araneus ventricosus]
MNISYPEARRLILARTPTECRSYASTVKTSLATSETQTKRVVILTTDSDSDGPSSPIKEKQPSYSKTRKSKSITKSERALTLKFSKQGSSVKSLKSRRSLALDLGKAGLATKDLPSLFGDPSSSELLKIHPSEDDDDLQMSCEAPATPLTGETFLKPNAHLKLRGYNCVRKDNDTDTSSGGVCLLTSNHFPSTTLNLHTSLQAVAVQVHIKTLVTVCCIYLPPNDTISQNDLNILVDQLPAPFILLGDFNGHSTLWGSESTNTLGRQIEQFISDNCICLLNNDEKTYFHEPTRTFHSLDRAICSPELLPLLKFSLEGDLHNSDNFPLIISPADNSSTTQSPPTYVFQCVD